MQRRDLLRWLMAGAGLKCLEGLAPDDLFAFGTELHRAQAEGQSFRSLDLHARRTVEVAAERIIPAGDTPGATDARVVAFVDRMLTDWYTVEERDRFLAGLHDLDRRCRSLRGRGFVECAEVDQVRVLTDLDEQVTALRTATRADDANDHWFAMLKFLTVWGYCTSEAGMRRTLGAWPKAPRYDGCATVAVPSPRRVG